MAEAAGRRPDETSSEQTEEQRLETWALALVGGLMLLALVTLVIFAGA
jgi:hypothetical protein